MIPLFTQAGRSVADATRRRGARQDEAGFTLVELLVAMSIFTVVMALTFTNLTRAMQRTSDLDAGNVAAGQSRAAFDQLTSDLRQAASLSPGVATIESIGPTTLTFLSPDRSTPVRMRRISYRLNAGTLERAMEVSTNDSAAPWVFPGAPPVWTEQITKVNNSTIFTGLTSAGAATTNGAAIRRIRVLVQQASAINAGTQTRFETKVTLRVVPA